MALSACCTFKIILKFSSSLGTFFSHSLNLFLMTFCLSSCASIKRFVMSSSPGGLISLLYLMPVSGSSFLFYNRIIASSSLSSNKNTVDGLILMAFNKFIWASFSGKPSITHPLTMQSLCFSLCSIRVFAILSGICSPLSMHLAMIAPFSGF